MTDPSSLLESLSASDPAARQEAKRALEDFVLQNPVTQGVLVAEQVTNERQARVLGGILGRAIHQTQLDEYVPLTSDEEGWVSTVARRAIRTWMENAAPAEASNGLQRCLFAAAQHNDARTDEFLCTTLIETVSREVHPAYRAIIPILEGIVAQHGGLRRNMSWLLGSPEPAALTPFHLALATLEGLLPKGDLPLPAEGISTLQDLPRPASEASEEDSAHLPLPAETSSEDGDSLSLWERLFGRRKE